MRAEDYEYLYKIEEHYWWFVAMRQIIDAIVGSDLKGRTLTMLDAGCGTGYNLRYYTEAGHAIFGLDLAEEAINGVQRRGFKRVCRASVTQIPYRSETFDFAFSFDVLDELSLDDVEKALCEIHRVLKPGGDFCIRLPAFEWMRSTHDDDIETIHRYTCREIQVMLQRTGFKVRVATYANTLLFPVIALRRALKGLGIGRGTDTKPLPKGLSWIDPILCRILAAEGNFLGAHRRFPFGLSVICYARKQ